MKKFFVFVTVFSSLLFFAKNDVPKPYLSFNKNIKIVAGQKYAYAEVVFQHYYKDKTWVNGKYVSDNIRADISKTTSPSQALDIMGENGWELTTSFTRNFDGGYEYYYYFKKAIN
ncbi:hypothetical protein OZ668_11055 [Elizabethkingia sp. HX XZB]|uniref:hypothetical protein n=1 Tax=Elizabethkingia sp. HX XZB TaxID=3003193 RepID=UPI002A239D4D|nr:hypothetical protein [Elizabethkingia sp. HX XZB]MDX8568529.1 hypothetical protein [Elizabethkingia sp. HX XZB]